jgi:hypoxanthine-guanine phosphoribosyltransferase
VAHPETADEICSAECVNVEVSRIARETPQAAVRHPLVLAVMRGSVIFGPPAAATEVPARIRLPDVTRYRTATVGGEIA